MELYACTYHHLWQLPTTVLRFFNVYGPHGRPDMMPWRWTEQILAGEPLTLYNAGKIQRDWTYIDDIVAGFMAAMDTAPAGEIMNLGRGRPVANIRFVQLLEGLLGRRAIIRDVPAPPTEPLITFANVEKARELLGYLPQVDVEEGLARFVGWLTAERVI
jgi:UDP-glucuronate 4-epimerase